MSVCDRPRRGNFHSEEREVLRLFVRMSHEMAENKMKDVFC